MQRSARQTGKPNWAAKRTRYRYFLYKQRSRACKKTSWKNIIVLQAEKQGFARKIL